jgi:hypothetical protein
MGFSNFAAYFGGRNARGGHHYDPNQPRVPKGNSDGGQWTDGGAGSVAQSTDDERRRLSNSWVRLASNEKPPQGSLPPERRPQGKPPQLPPSRGRLGLLLKAAYRLFQMISDYRRENPPDDLFGTATDENSTIAVTTINNKPVFGSNSGHHTYTAADDSAAKQMRAILVTKHPHVFKAGNLGQAPNVSLFHAETTVLLRAAKENGGTLAGMTLEIATDRVMCPSCPISLPYVVRELGNPTVTFIDNNGNRYSIGGPSLPAKD